jgi:uncharacterized protein YdeI (YjbR/CyaY-like superfamily)
MSWLSELLKKIKPQLPAVDRETALWLAFKALTPSQRAAVRVDISTARRALTDPKLVEEARAFLDDAWSAVNR